MTILLLAPLAILWLMFFAYPMVQLIIISTRQTNFMKTVFVGLDNYINTFQDAAFWLAVSNSLKYAAMMIPAVVIISFAMACFISRMSKPWRNASRMVFYIPALSAGIIIAGFWKWFFHIDGVVNWILGTNVSWFAQGATALPVIAAIVVTGNLGGTLIMTLASVEAVDPGMLDAARIDGASWGQIKRKIVLPTVSPTLALIALLAWINARQIIETPMMLAPQDFAATLTYHIYRQGFLFGNYGMASAQAVILLLIIGGLALAKRRIEK